ncbi:MAG: 16S rRNA (cytidine(1402)-2'-O)-methyltransferase [Candidatus Omnitrophota bacterium]
MLEKETGVLFVVATPIGNINDITFRAIEVLKSVDIIACEDTRRTGILLKYFGIKKHTISYYQYNRLSREEVLIAYLKDGKNIALVSDAGMPGISDPGVHLIKEAINRNIKVEVIPGAVAHAVALVVSGFATDRFSFCGFLPVKTNKKREKIIEYHQRGETIICYESPHRLLKTLSIIYQALGDIDIAVCRELTKKFEQVLRDKVSVLIDYFSRNKPRGEFVIVFGRRVK